jgi:hypothetical protein
MLKTLAIAAITLGFASSAFAMDCTQENLDKLDKQVTALTDKTVQESAMKEVQMAKDLMAKKDLPGCTTHIDSAMKAGNIKMQ